MKKTYVIDTNVLLEDENAIEVLRNGEENEVLIPYKVIEELDGLKKDPKKRELVLRAVDSILRNFEYLRFIKDKTLHSNDATILKALLEDSAGHAADSVMITNDRIFRLLCQIEGVKSEEYRSSKPIQSDSESYTGYITQGESAVPNCFEWVEGKPHYHSNNGVRIIDYEHEVWNVRPRSVYQNLAFELLLDNSLDLVTLQSQAGYGKTFLALATALYLTLEKKLFEKIYIVKSPIEIGPALGFLPGDILEKLDPYYRPIYDLVHKLHGFRPARRVYESDQPGKFDRKVFEVLPLAFIRGMNLEHAIVIVDEMQNLSRSETRALLTRMGEGTRCFCLGDTKQVDNPYLNEFNNGLNWIVSLCKGQPNYGHLVLKGTKSRGQITDLVLKVGL